MKENKKNTFTNFFKKSINSLIPFRDKQSRLSFINQSTKKQDTREIENAIYNDFQEKLNYIQSINSVVSNSLRIITDKINTFNIKAYIKKNNEKIYIEHDFLNLINNPNKTIQRTMQELMISLVQKIKLYGKVYILHDKLSNSITIINQYDVGLNEINSYLLRGFEKMPIEIQMTISVVNENNVKGNIISNYIYDYEKNYYICKTNCNLSLYRIVDNSFPDTKYSNTSVLSSVFKLVSIYENYLNSMYSFGSNAVNGKMVMPVIDAFGGEEKINKLKEDFNNAYTGISKHGNIGFFPITSKEGNGNMQTIDISTAPKDMLFAENISFIEIKIYQAFGIPEQLISGVNAHFDSRDSSDISFSENQANFLQNILDHISFFLNSIYGLKKENYVYFDVDKLSCTALYNKELMKFKESKDDLSINERREFFGKKPIQGKVYNAILRNVMATPIEDIENEYLDEENRMIEKDKIKNPNIEDKSIFSSKQELEDELMKILEN